MVVLDNKPNHADTKPIGASRQRLLNHCKRAPTPQVVDMSCHLERDVHRRGLANGLSAAMRHPCPAGFGTARSLAPATPGANAQLELLCPAPAPTSGQACGGHFLAVGKRRLGVAHG